MFIIISDPPTKYNKIEMEEYLKVTKTKPAFAVILNNEKFNIEEKQRKGTDVDEKSISSLVEKFKGRIVFHEHILKNLTADEIHGAFKMLAKHDPDPLSDAELDGALKLYGLDEILPPTLPVENKKKALKKVQKINFDQYSCFMAFIMSHGNEDGIAGKDVRMVKVNTLSSYFTPNQCEGLGNKPKIFFIQACRGPQLDKLDDISYQAATDSMLYDGLCPLFIRY